MRVSGVAWRTCVSVWLDGVSAQGIAAVQAALQQVCSWLLIV
jgi:hypothetical protein